MSDRMVTIATFHDPLAAALAKNYLEGQGIPSELFDEDTIATGWMLAGAVGGIKLQVEVIHVERAEMLLEQIQEERAKADAEAAAGPPENAIATQEIAEELQADREDQAPINQQTDRLFRTAVFGLLFWPLQLYALYLLAEIWSMDARISPDRRWKIWASMLLNVPIVATAVILALWALSVFD
ncbi:MAG: DUF2007 domain-containing protein [Planctomycetes bacterium]|nr:DUF2007 domain-containing protein [Planctomycetota bacterium]